MATTQDIFVPDIGTTDEVDVIDVLIHPGDELKVDDPLVTLESDKASMDVPSPIAGRVQSVAIKVGDKIKEGGLIARIELADAKPSETKTSETKAAAATPSAEKVASASAPSAPAVAPQPAATTNTHAVNVPDLGTDALVDVIEITVKVGDEINVDSPLLTLESDKASMDVPSPVAGKVQKILVKVGDQVKAGMPIVEVAVIGAAPAASATSPSQTTQPLAAQQEQASAEPSAAQPAALTTPAEPLADQSDVHAGPAVRRLARELGVDLHRVTGTGRKGRAQLEDIHQYVKAALKQSQSGAGASGGFNLPKAPVIDFSKFGEITVQPLSKIKKISGANLQRNWITIPHVTQFDEADITELEDFRNANKSLAEKKGYKLTPLVFIMKAVVATLQEFPTVNASLDETGEKLILKNYYHIGVAVDTPNGLVVPVIRNVDQKSVTELAKELAEVSVKARDKGLSLTDMQGASFTISSLGGISGTGFTPIVNLPEVAILGVSRSSIKPVYQEGQFVPRLMLPLSFSYDHRVIDGAEAARFTKHLSLLLSDIRRILL